MRRHLLVPLHPQGLPLFQVAIFLFSVEHLIAQVIMLWTKTIYLVAKRERRKMVKLTEEQNAIYKNLLNEYRFALQLVFQKNVWQELVEDGR
jgi:hypothetical protein